MDLEPYLARILRIQLTQGQGRETALVFIKVLLRELEKSPHIISNFLPVSRLLSAVEELMQGEGENPPPEVIERITLALQVLGCEIHT